MMVYLTGLGMSALDLRRDACLHYGLRARPEHFLDCTVRITRPEIHAAHRIHKQNYLKSLFHSIENGKLHTIVCRQPTDEYSLYPPLAQQICQTDSRSVYSLKG